MLIADVLGLYSPLPDGSLDGSREISQRGHSLLGVVWEACRPLLSLASAATLAAVKISPTVSLTDQIEEQIVLIALLKSHPVTRNTPKARTGLLSTTLVGKSQGSIGVRRSDFW